MRWNFLLLFSLKKNKEFWFTLSKAMHGEGNLISNF